MKKAFKIFGIFIAVILVLMIVLPIMFKGKIKEVLVKEGNEMIDARFDFDRLSLSLFRDFPAVSASLYDFWIVGKDRFEGDTLIRAGRVSLSFGLMSLFGDDGYDIRRIAVENTTLNAIVLEDGKANWDIMKSTGEEEQADTTSAPSAIRIKLKNLTLKNVALSYDDRQGKMLASIGSLGASLSGDFTAAQSTLKLVADASGINFRSGGVPYLRNADFYAKMDVDADIEKGKYTLAQNVFRLNAIEAGVDGWVEMLADEGYDMDLKLATPKISFKEILSLIPAVYAKDFEGVQASGEVALEGWAKGTYINDNLPAFKLDLKVSNGTFRYPDLPAGVDAINIAAVAENPGGVADLTSVKVNPFSFTLAGNPFSVKAWIATPVSNMAFDLEARGKLDLGKVKDVYPLDSLELNGLVNADVQVAGVMSSIEKEQYDQLRAQGTVALTDMILKQTDGMDVNIKKSTLTFSPRYVDLSETSLLMGSNDLTLDCRVENYLAYALKDGTLKGTMNLRSNYLNANEFLTDEAAPAAEEESAPMSAFEVPKNLDLAVNASLKEVVYDKINIRNLAGNIVVKDGVANMKNLSMNTLGGAVKMFGSYSTARSAEQPELAADLAMTGLSFAETFGSFVTIQKIAPLFENLQGNFSGAMNLTTTLDKEMTPVFNTMNGHGSLQTKDLSLSEIGVIKKIGEIAQLQNLTNSKVKDLKIDFTIAEGKVQTKPFDIKLGDVNINLSGTTSLDQSIAYTGKIQLPEGLSKTLMMSSANVKIGGTFSSPQVSLDMKDMASQVIQTAVTNALTQAGEKLGIDLSDATKQKEALVKAAQENGQKLMDEAQKQADALVAKAGKDPISQLAAKKASEAALSKAQKSVDNLVAKATAQGDSIISKAQAGQ